MPKVSLGKQQQADENFRRLIRMQLTYTGLNTQKALAKKLDMREETLSRKMANPDTFTRGEVRAICTALRIDPQDYDFVI